MGCTLDSTCGQSELGSATKYMCPWSAHFYVSLLLLFAERDPPCAGETLPDGVEFLARSSRGAARRSCSQRLGFAASSLVTHACACRPQPSASIVVVPWAWSAVMVAKWSATAVRALTAGKPAITRNNMSPSCLLTWRLRPGLALT